MNKTAGRAATILTIAIAALSLTACGGSDTECPKAAAVESSTLTITTAAYLPERTAPHPAPHPAPHEPVRTAPIFGNHGGHSQECTK